MKKKVFFFLAIAMLLSVMSGCFLKTKLDDSIPVNKHSVDIIRAQYEKGKITREEAAILTVQAVYLPDKLPKHYKSDPEIELFFEINNEWCWIAENWENLSAETKEILQPYFVEPNDPDSYFYTSFTDKEVGFFDALIGSKTVYAAEDYKPLRYSTVHHEGIVSIHYYNPSASAAENNLMKAKAELVLETFTVAWPMFKNLLNVEPTNHFNVYLVQIENENVWGEARWQNSPLKYWINIGKNLEGKKLQAVTAHELFHIFQFYYAPYYRTFGDEQDWIRETTATWSMHYVYPDYNIEHLFVPNFFKHVDRERIINTMHMHYSNYVFFHFLTQYTGSAEVVGEIIEKCKQGGVRDNLPKAIASYESTFSQFALYCWDRDPFEAFADIPTFPHQGAGAEACTYTGIIDRTETKETEVLSPGGCNYHSFSFPDEEISKVIFDFSATEKNKSIRRQALILINDVWMREDWSELPERIFCRAKPEERVNQVIIAWGNADLNTAYKVNYTVNTEEICEPAKTGFMRITETSSNPYGSWKAVLESHEEIEYVHEENYDALPFRIVKRDMTFIYNYSIQESGPPPYGIISRITTATGNLSETYERDASQPLRIEIIPGNRIKIYFRYDNTENRSWVTYNNTVTIAGTTQSYSEQSEPIFTQMPEMYFYVKEDEIFENKIKGTKVYEASSGSVTLKTVIEFEYDLVLPNP